MKRPYLPSTYILFSIALGSCGEEEIKTYKVASDDVTQEEQTMPAEKAPQNRAANESKITWQAPKGWTQEEAGQFLTAAYKIPGGGRVTVSNLAGDGGGLAANVNRWRGQVGMEPAPENNLGGKEVPIPGSNRMMLLLDLVPETLAADSDGILAAVLPLDSETWYFKFTATAGILREKGGEFAELLRSIQVAGEQETGAAPEMPGKPPIEVAAPDGWETEQGKRDARGKFHCRG